MTCVWVVARSYWKVPPLLTDAFLFVQPMPVCDSCQACLADDDEDGTQEWGMNFACPGWSSRGDCVTHSRLGLHPFDERLDSSSDPVVPTNPASPTPLPPNSNISEVEEKNESLRLTIVIMALTIGFMIFLGICFCVCFVSRKRQAGPSSPSHPQGDTGTVAGSVFGDEEPGADLGDEEPAAALPGVGYETEEAPAHSGSYRGTMAPPTLLDGDFINYDGGNNSGYLHNINTTNKLNVTESTDGTGHLPKDSFAVSL